MWPNFWGLEEAPATAMRGEDMKVRAAVCMFVVSLVVLSVVVVVDFRRFCDLVVAGISGWEVWVLLSLSLSLLGRGGCFRFTGSRVFS